MSEAKDPAIKLFGKTIPLPEILPPPAAVTVGAHPPPLPPSNPPVSKSLNQEDKNSNRVEEDQHPDEAPSGKRPNDTGQEDGEAITDPNASGVVNDNPKTPSFDNEAATSKTSKKTEEEDQSENNSSSQEKTLKKPDKIIPCPRCNSMDTKFCYFNNYNVNQPRHFCKNCQRYWTAGGTMRNVPVGAGRRKNKNSTSLYRHIAVSEALQNARADVPSGIIHHHPTLKPNGTVLAFGSDTPLCESMASVLNITENTIQDHARNGFCKPEELRISVSHGVRENGSDRFSGSSVTTIAHPKDDVGENRPEVAKLPYCHSFSPQMPCFQGPTWPYPWNPVQWAPPGFCPPGYPMPFYPPPPYWGCTLPGTWNVPWVVPPSQTSPNSVPNSPTLGKHCRDEDMLIQTSSGEDEAQKENNAEGCLWIPKTLRIDDPGEAAKSSIWATLGIKNDKVDSTSKGSLFKAFQSKSEEKNCVSETSSVLQANPAAFSRSLNFQEGS